MANTVTSLIPDIYAAFDVVSREPVGFIESVTRDAKADRVALNQTLRSFATAANTAGRTITPAMAFPTAAYQTVANKALTITKSKVYPFSWTGEEEFSLDSSGPGSLTIRQDQIAQCFRAATNEIENDLATAAYQGASRACGAAGTTPFVSTVAGSALAGQILTDNGAPLSDRNLVINTTAGANLRTLMQLTRANEAGTAETLRSGSLLNLNNFNIRESAQLATQVVGTASGAATDTAGYAVGATAITLQATGTGTIKVGDVVTFAGDTNKYISTTLVPAVSGGALVLAAPGLRVAIGASNVALTVGSTFTPNVAFTRNAIVLATRLPAIPRDGDMALHREILTDPVSKISYEVSIYPGYKMVTIEIGLNWGLFVTKPEHIANLLG